MGPLEQEARSSEYSEYAQLSRMANELKKMVRPEPIIIKIGEQVQGWGKIVHNDRRRNIIYTKERRKTKNKAFIFCN